VTVADLKILRGTKPQTGYSGANLNDTTASPTPTRTILMKYELNTTTASPPPTSTAPTATTISSYESGLILTRAAAAASRFSRANR